MSEEIRQVLQMVAEGKIDVEEGERLIEALKGRAAPASASVPARLPRYLHVVVNDGASKVNIRVPMQLIRAGMKLTSLIPESAKGHVEKHLSEQGINFNLSKLKAEDLDELVKSLEELQVDVGDGGSTVRIYCE